MWCNIFLKIILFLIVKDVVAENYGPFDVKIININACKGPKSKDCGTISFKIIDGKRIWATFDVYEDLIPNKGRISMFNTATKKQVMRLQLDNPCKHLFLRPILENLLKVSADCKVKKGHYSNEVDIESIAKKYYGGSFLYGNITFKSFFYNNKCNMACSVIDLELYPA